MSSQISINNPTNNPSPYADYFSENYFESRQAFMYAAQQNQQVTSIENIEISAAGCNREQLSIDIAWVGNTEATNILVHISGTHGVEGYAGSAIQQGILKGNIELNDNTAIILIHALNPYGMATFRRVNENNVDLNRNFPDKRVTSPYYEEINNLMNPKQIKRIDFFHMKLIGSILKYGWSNLKNALASGQYDFPRGLFYGGKEIQEGPKKILNWFNTKFSDPKYQNIRMGIIDVHTGLGPYAEDTLLTIEKPSDQLMKYFGEKIKTSTQNQTVGYKASGMFVEELRATILKVTNCAKERIFILGQEFGTVSVYSVLIGLRNENRATHCAKLEGKELSPESPERQELLKVFYPKDRLWRQKVVESGQDVINKSLTLLQV